MSTLFFICDIIFNIILKTGPEGLRPVRAMSCKRKTLAPNNTLIYLYPVKKLFSFWVT